MLQYRFTMKYNKNTVKSRVDYEVNSYTNLILLLNLHESALHHINPMVLSHSLQMHAI